MVGPAKAWSVVDRLTSMVDPASTCSAVAGRSTVTVTGLPSAGRFVSRIGRDGAAGQRPGAALGDLRQRAVEHGAVVGGAGRRLRRSATRRAWTP